MLVIETNLEYELVYVGFGPADGDGDIPATNRKKTLW
jgi:hypothetical protein